MTKTWEQSDIDSEMFRNDDIEECDHLEAELDILTGRIDCSCGWHKYLSAEEYKKHAESQAKYYEEYHAQMEEAVKQELEKEHPEIPTKLNDNELPF